MANSYASPTSGTAVAGVAAGLLFGTATSATLANVKVQNPQRLGDIPTAIRDVILQHQSYRDDPNSPWRGSVINLSITVPDSELLKSALREAASAGIREWQTKAVVIPRSVD